jgi:hypothetical protein
MLTATSNTTMHSTTTTMTTLTPPPTTCSNPSTTHHVTKPSQHAFSTSTTHSQPPAMCYRPQPCVSTTSNVFLTPSLVFQPLSTCFNHPQPLNYPFRPPSHRFWAPAVCFKPPAASFEPQQHFLTPSSVFEHPWPLSRPQHAFSPPSTRFQPHHMFLTPPPSFLHSRDTHMCVSRGFFFFFIFCSSLHPSNLFRPADTCYKPPDTCFKPPAACFGHLRPQPKCFDHLRPPATHSLASQAPKHMYEQSYVHFFFCLFFFGFGTACTSSHTCVSDVFIYFILFYST